MCIGLNILQLLGRGSMIHCNVEVEPMDTLRIMPLQVTLPLARAHPRNIRDHS